MKIEVRDQLGNLVQLDGPARRIVSLVPSQTEWLAYLGLEDHVVGITKFCVHPFSWKKKKNIIGGTKSVHFERIRQLEPDLIIGNKEENTRDVMDALSTRYNCYISDVSGLDSAIEMMKDIGKLTGTEDKATHFTDHLKWLYSRTLNSTLPKNAEQVAYVIWNEPVMVAGNETYIHQILSSMGWKNAFGDKERYPVIEDEEWKERKVDAVLLSSEPFPFSEKHFPEFEDRVPGADIRLVDGELFSWYGWRLVKTLTILPNFE